MKLPDRTQDTADGWKNTALNQALEIDRLKKMLDEIHEYLIAAADGSMSRNNSEQLASELLEQLDRVRKQP